MSADRPFPNGTPALGDTQHTPITQPEDAQR